MEDEDKIMLRFSHSFPLKAPMKCDLSKVHTVLTNNIDEMVVFIDNVITEIIEFPKEDFEGEIY